MHNCTSDEVFNTSEYAHNSIADAIESIHDDSAYHASNSTAGADDFTHGEHMIFGFCRGKKEH